MKLTSYQRGNRDGLLSAAAEYEATAEHHRLLIERYESAPGYKPNLKMHTDTMDRYRSVRETCLAVAYRLRRLAEALPEDPEE